MDKERDLGIFVACFISSILPISVLAEEGKTEVVGKLYEFDEDSNYEFHEKAKSQDTTSDNTYGLFSICGNISNVGKNQMFRRMRSQMENLIFITTIVMLY